MVLACSQICIINKIVAIAKAHIGEQMRHSFLIWKDGNCLLRTLSVYKNCNDPKSCLLLQTQFVFLYCLLEAVIKTLSREY